MNQLPADDGAWRTTMPALSDVTVVVPVRNGEHMLAGCLESVVRSRPNGLVVVDGMSIDSSREVAARYGATVLSDEGRGLPAARMLGVQHASTRWVALIDADVELPDGALEELFHEYIDDGYLALQAGLHSSSGEGYWGRALTFHHRTGRSRNWFGVVATIAEREVLLEHGFDPSFLSGEDIDLRWRLRRIGRIGVSKRTIVRHRFEADTFAFARGQWLADGEGLGRMVRKQGWRAAPLVGLPIAAGLRGVAVSLIHRQPQWLPYFWCFTAYNYVGMARGVRAR